MHRLAGRRIDAQFAIAALGAAVGRVGRGHRAGVFALRIARTADEGAETAGLQAQLAFMADRAFAGIGSVALVREDVRTQRLVQVIEDRRGAQFACGLRGGVEVLPEAAQQGLPVQIARRHLVQLGLQRGGEVVLDPFGEELLEEGRDQPSLVLRVEAVLVHADVFAVAQGRQDGGVGRRATDAQLFQLLDQGGFREARRRFGEVLVGADRLDLGLGAFLQRGQAAAFVFLVLSALLLLVAAFFIGGDEAVEDHDLAGGAQAGLAVGRLDLDRGAVQARRLHLRGDHSLPDQLVQALQVVLEPQGVGAAQDVGRTNGFVRFLGVLGLGLVVARLGRDIGGAETLADGLARLGDALGRHIDAVGTHVGDQAAGVVDALIQLLRRLHGALGGEAQLARGFLLQGRGGEGRGGGPLGRLLLDRLDGEVAAVNGLARRHGHGLGHDVQALDALAVMLDQTGGEGRAVGDQVGLDRPVFLSLELLDLHLAIDDDAQGD